MDRTVAVVASTAIVALLGGLGAYTFLADRGAGDRFDACRTTAIAGGAESIGGPFTLLDASGATVTDQDVITKPSLVYFGYTFCPDVCPLDTVRNAEAVDILAERGYDVTPVFISIDPERDTPEIVGDFVYNVHEKMVGLTGSAEQIAAASKAYRTYYKSHADGTDDYYLVDHSTFTYLVTPEEGFLEFFRREIAPDAMADTVQCFLDRR